MPFLLPNQQCSTLQSLLKHYARQMIRISVSHNNGWWPLMCKILSCRKYTLRGKTPITSTSVKQSTKWKTWNQHAITHKPWKFHKNCARIMGHLYSQIPQNLQNFKYGTDTCQSSDIICAMISIAILQPSLVNITKSLIKRQTQLLTSQYLRCSSSVRKPISDFEVMPWSSSEKQQSQTRKLL